MRVTHLYPGDCNFTYHGVVGKWGIFLYRTGEYCAYLNHAMADCLGAEYETGNTLRTEDGQTWEWVASWYMKQLMIPGGRNPLINMDVTKVEQALLKYKLGTDSHTHRGEEIHF